MKKCEFCKSEVKTETFDYQSPILDFESQKPIVVFGVRIYKCTNAECGHSWIPGIEEKKIDLKVSQRSRERLNSSQIALLRESFGFSTKTEAANFLNLNTKAFVKWEKEHFVPNDAYDLLIRLVAHSHENFEFVKHLHATNFKFNPNDYELLSASVSFGSNLMKTSTLASTTYAPPDWTVGEWEVLLIQQDEAGKSFKSSDSKLENKLSEAA